MNEKKLKWIYQISLLFIIIFSCSFIAFMGYINFKSSHKDIKNQIYREINSEAVVNIENAIRFGKTLNNYYGMDQIFTNLKKDMEEDIDFFITDKNGMLLYSSFQSQDVILNKVYESLLDKAAKSSILQITEGGNYQSYTLKNRNYIIQPIKNQKEIIGLFYATYDNDVIYKQLYKVQSGIIINTSIVIAVVLILFIMGDYYINKKSYKNKKVKHAFPIILIMTAMFFQSIFAIVIYKNSYKESMMLGGNQILNNLNSGISGVLENGVELEDINGVQEYLTEKIEKIPILWNVKILNEIANAANSTGRENKLLINFDLYGETIKLEAELSSKYINDKIMQVILLMVSALIIIIILIIEIIRIPGMILYCSSKKNNKECEESYKQVSNSLRLTSFLCSTAEYMCLPYAAMIIRDMNESVFGLSVGMTAALPLSLEGLTQAAAMFILPRFIKKIDIKSTLIISCIMMVVCNIFTFSSDSVMSIIILRGVAGIAYAGFKQITNYIITRGYHNELQRSLNLSQDNAGLIGGVTCGAGLGAIISATGGYFITFIISALVFCIYLIITLYIIPWKLLKQVKRDEEKEYNSIRQVLRMTFSWEMIKYVILLAIPLNLAVMLCVTLIPAICQSNGISNMVLSYCYIVNGIAGMYIGPSLVNWSKKRFGLQKSIGFSFAITGISIYILRLPLLALMIIISSLILGFIDGFATPLTTDLFLNMKIIKKTAGESTALIYSALLSYILAAIAPIAAELMMIKTNSLFDPLIIVSVIYSAVAIFLFMKRKKTVQS